MSVVDILGGKGRDSLSEKQGQSPTSRLKTRRILKLTLEAISVLSIPFFPSTRLLDLLDELRRSRSSLDEKITEAFRSMQKATELIDELEGTLKERTEKLNLLRQDYERYSKLVEVEEEKARPIMQQIELILKMGKGRDRLERLIISLVAGIIVFFLGIFLGPLVRAWLRIG